MDKAEFIQQHLIGKGVPVDLTKPTVFSWIKYKDPTQKPLVFQSPIKVFLTSSLFNGLSWGLLMYFFAWNSTPNYWVEHLILSAFFGILMGLLKRYRVMKFQKVLGETNWKNWCNQNYQ